MTAPTRPAGVKTFGNEKRQFAPAFADITAPKLSEVTASAGLDISCYMYASSDKPGGNQNRVTPPPRVCDTQQYEALGLFNWVGGNIEYAVDPQAAGGSAGKKAYETLTEGTTGFIVVRYGIAVATDFAVGQFVRVYPITLGKQVEMPQGTDESAEYAIQQAFGITGQPSALVAIVTG